MTGLKKRIKVFGTTATNASLYSNWTFKNGAEWDEFNDSRFNIYMLNTYWYRVGIDHLESSRFDISIKETVHKGASTNKKILGLPIEFKDITERLVKFKPAE